MSGPEQLARLQHAAPQVLPSLLLCDFGNLEREVLRLEAAGVQALHLDVMDGNFVPNLTYGMPIVAGLRKLTDLPLDVHLMINHPDRYVEQFHRAGADIITFHVEAVDDPNPVLDRIRDLGAAAGLAFNPATPLDRVEPHLQSCDLVLVMSVPAGFGGQEFDTRTLEKLRVLVAKKRPELVLEVDGGINVSTIRQCADAGAELFVVGSAIFNHADYGAAVQELTSLIV